MRRSQRFHRWRVAGARLPSPQALIDPGRSAAGVRGAVQFRSDCGVQHGERYSGGYDLRYSI